MHEGEIFKAYLTEKAISVTEAAEILGKKDRQSIYNYFKTEKFHASVKKDIKKKFGLNFKKDLKRVPFYDVDITATNSPVIAEIQAMKPKYYINIPIFSQGSIAVRITGDSMYPKFRHGDIIVCKRIMNPEFIIYGEIYLIITKSDNFRTVKYLIKGNGKDELIMKPYNEAFQDQAIPKEEILQLYRVLGSICEV